MPVPAPPGPPPAELKTAGQVRTIGLLKSESEGLTAGIATGALVAWEGAPVFFLFSDSTSCTTERTETSSAMRFEGELEYRGAAHRFIGEFQNGVDGTLAIDGRIYGISNGNVLLVSGSDGTLRVEQLNRDLTAINPDDRTSWATFLKADPAVIAFFSKTADAN